VRTGQVWGGEKLTQKGKDTEKTVEEEKQSSLEFKKLSRQREPTQKKSGTDATVGLKKKSKGSPNMK